MDKEKILLYLKINNYNFEEHTVKRIINYEYAENTVVIIKKDEIKIRTECNIKGIYNTLILFPNGRSKLDFEF